MCVPSHPKPGYTSSAMKMPPALRIASTAGEESGRSGKSAAAGEHVSVEERCRYFVRHLFVAGQPRAESKTALATGPGPD
jgi:hypothetical protein